MSRKPPLLPPAVLPSTILVCVPRGVFDRYWPLPWADVVAAAKCGVDGLAIHQGPPARYMCWVGDQFTGEPAVNSGVPLDVAFLRDGEGPWRGRPWLYQQNW